MISSEVQRTLVKSPPELWAELSDPDALARHLGELGDVCIVRTEPEKTVEWAAENATGTVSIQPSGWGTKVTLSVTRQIAEQALAAESPPEAMAEPDATPEAAAPEPEPRRGFFARLFGRHRRAEPPEIVEEPASAEAPASEQETPAGQMSDLSAELMAAEEAGTEEVTAVLTAVLDRLGAAHHRPFSRA